ncbi:MAG: phosphatase [Actinomycetota bacterium]
MSAAVRAEVAAALVAGGVAGPHVSHARAKSIEKLRALISGLDPEATFGLSGSENWKAEDLLAAMAKLTGCSPDAADLSCEDQIEPELTIGGLEQAGLRLLSFAQSGAGLVVATGHPTGLLEFYMRVIDAYVDAGGKLLRPAEGRRLPIRKPSRHYEVRYIGGVGCLADWGSLKHTHAADAMDVLLEETPGPDIVLGDHGFAGSAVARGIPTVAIMDVNDHALAAAWTEGRDVTIVPMDDNRPPRFYEPAWRFIAQILSGGR